MSHVFDFIVLFRNGIRFVTKLLSEYLFPEESWKMTFVKSRACQIVQNDLLNCFPENRTFGKIARTYKTRYRENVFTGKYMENND